MAEEKKYSIFDFSKLSLNATQGKAQLKFNIYRNNPRIVIFTNDEKDRQQNSAPMSANMDPYSFMSFLQMLQSLVSAPAETKYKIENLTLKGEGKDRTIAHASDLMLGKDANGVIWISVLMDGRPKFKFEIGDYKYHKFMHGDGKEMSKAEVSQMAAKGMVTLLSNIFSTYLTTNYEHVPATAFKGNNRSGGYNGGQRSRAPADDDMSEDLPF